MVVPPSFPSLPACFGSTVTAVVFLQSSSSSSSSLFHHPSPIIHHPSSIVHHPSWLGALGLDLKRGRGNLRCFRSDSHIQSQPLQSSSNDTTREIEVLLNYDISILESKRAKEQRKRKRGKEKKKEKEKEEKKRKKEGKKGETKEQKSKREGKKHTV